MSVIETPTAENRKRNSLWTRTRTQNLRRYKPSGTYFIRGRFGSLGIVQESLETDDYEVAKIKLHKRREELRSISGRAGSAPRTLHEALDRLRAQIDADPSRKPNTKKTCRDRLKPMCKGGKCPLPDTPLLKLTCVEMLNWWSGVVARYNPIQANAMLGLLRRAIKLARKHGGITDDPTEELKRAKLEKKRRRMPTPEEFRAIVDDLRSQHHPISRHTADRIEFAAYTGARPAEINKASTFDVDFQQEGVWINGVKNNTERRFIPFNPALRSLLERMRDRPWKPGRLFTTLSPKKALWRSCERLNLGYRMQVYDLRRFFITVCVESDVNIRTIAEWVGHRDGGKLVLSTYAQTRDEHSRTQAAKVTFGPKTA